MNENNIIVDVVDWVRPVTMTNNINNNDQLIKIKNKKSFLWKILDIIFILLTGIFIGFLIGIYI
jgi:hypothetical protein